MRTSEGAPQADQLEAADQLVFRILHQRARQIERNVAADPEAELTPTDLAVLKELRRSAKDLRARREAAEEALSQGAGDANAKASEVAKQNACASRAPRHVRRAVGGKSSRSSGSVKKRLRVAPRSP